MLLTGVFINIRALENWYYLLKLNIFIFYDPAILFWYICKRSIYVYVSKDTIRMIIAKTWGEGHMSIDSRKMNKLWCSHTMK